MCVGTLSGLGEVNHTNHKRFIDLVSVTADSTVSATIRPPARRGVTRRAGLQATVAAIGGRSEGSGRQEKRGRRPELAAAKTLETYDEAAGLPRWRIRVPSARWSWSGSNYCAYLNRKLQKTVTWNGHSASIDAKRDYLTAAALTKVVLGLRAE